MAALLPQLLDVCFLRRGPQDLPYSLSATAGAVGALLAVQVVAALLVERTPSYLPARLAIALVMLLIVTPQLLRRRGLGNRSPQTILAQAGTDALFALAMLPLLLWLAGLRDAAPESQAALVPGMVLVAMFVWKLRVDAAIWRQALDLRAPIALLLAIGLVLFQLLLLMALAPPPPAPPPTGS